MYSWLLKLATPVIMGWVRTGLVGLAVYLTAKGYIAPADQAGLVASAMVLAGMGFSAGSKILAHQKTTAAVAVAAAEYPVGVASEAPLVGQIPAVASPTDVPEEETTVNLNKQSLASHEHS